MFWSATKRGAVFKRRLVFILFYQSILSWCAVAFYSRLVGDAYLPMPQSLSNILVHLIWSTKDRRPLLTAAIRLETHAFLAGAVRQCGCEAYRVGGVPDHVHLAVRLSRTLSVSELVKEVKTASSKWLKAKNPDLEDFHWQLGYGAFSIGMSQRDALIHYIENQEDHHRTRTFQDEYRDFLIKYEVAFDERYIWD